METTVFAAHEAKFKRAQRFADILLRPHEPRMDRAIKDVFCIHCGNPLNTPTAMLSPCEFAPRCDICNSKGVVQTIVLWKPVPGGFTPVYSRLPCVKCFPACKPLEEEYWLVVGETLHELKHHSSKPILPQETVGVS